MKKCCEEVSSHIKKVLNILKTEKRTWIDETFERISPGRLCPLKDAIGSLFLDEYMLGKCGIWIPHKHMTSSDACLWLTSAISDSIGERLFRKHCCLYTTDIILRANVFIYL